MYGAYRRAMRAIYVVPRETSASPRMEEEGSKVEDVTRAKGLTHEHRVADVVVCANVLARVCDGVHYARCEPELRQVAHDAREYGVVDCGQLRAVC